MPGTVYPGVVPMTPDEFYAQAMRAADAEGRLPLSRMTAWDVFPFEQAGLRASRIARCLADPVTPARREMDSPLRAELQ